MKTKNLFLIVFLCLVSAASFSQTSESVINQVQRKDSVELQNNSLLENARDNMANILSRGYGYGNAIPVTIGAEISGCFYYSEYPWMENYGVSLALYAGHSNASDKKGHGSAGLFSMFQIYSDKSIGQNSNDGFISFSPGISVFSKNRKFSLDLYHILSTQPLINGKQLIVPYKVNFHF
jgi:hypothetical protein